jgi:hypothetical protein
MHKALITPVPATAAAAASAAAYVAGCGHNYQWPDQGMGWDVAALSDSHPEYKGSCGACFEIKCESSSVRDGYGEPCRMQQQQQLLLQGSKAGLPCHGVTPSVSAIEGTQPLQQLL